MKIKFYFLFTIIFFISLCQNSFSQESKPEEKKNDKNSEIVGIDHGNNISKTKEGIDHGNNTDGRNVPLEPINNNIQDCASSFLLGKLPDIDNSLCVSKHRVDATITTTENKDTTYIPEYIDNGLFIPQEISKQFFSKNNATLTFHFPFNDCLKNVALNVSMLGSDNKISIYNQYTYIGINTNVVTLQPANTSNWLLQISSSSCLDGNRKKFTAEQQVLIQLNNDSPEKLQFNVDIEANE